jgi:beta-lactamase regulating signal transducer with metallopeptidase domain
MTALLNFHGLVPAAVQGMFYCLLEGTVLAALVWFLLRLVPRKNSGTRFAIWFSTLVAMIVLPCLTALPRSGMPRSGHGITVSASVTYALFYSWLVVAGIGLARIALGLWQLHRLRRSCVEIDSLALTAESRKVVEQLRSRSVTICSSSRLEVPTAIGLFKPAIVVPAWLIQEATPDELQHVLLHELAHLRRRDDWTNLAQKIVRAVLFFHPLVWWIERRLSLDREIACDDAVLSQTASPDLYARCLAHIAEKSFIRRQIALAQAAVNRVRHLSLRVEQILHRSRPATTRLWKPAIPLVTMLAVVCMLAASRTPRLLSFAGGEVTQSAPMTLANVESTPAQNSTADAPQLPVQNAKLIVRQGTFHSSNVALKTRTPVHLQSASKSVESVHDMANLAWSREATSPETLAAFRVPEGATYFASYQETIVTSDGNQPSAQNVSYQIRVLQVRIIVPTDQPEKRTTKKI